MRILIASTAVLFWFSLSAVAPQLRASTPTSAAALEHACSSLLRRDFARGTDAPAYVTSAAVVKGANGLPDFCRAQGYVVPNTGFEIRLPTGGWNGKFFYAGCTGSCGFAADSPWVAECDYPLTRGYACIVADMGHRSTSADGLWAWRNLEAKVDFGFRATHRAALAGKAITNAYYSRPPKYSYFMGCSTGGRQALIEAQRFPTDFDGIIAGAPVISEGGTSMSFIWNLRTLAALNGRPIFSEADLSLLHQAALAKGDMSDGLRDGIIGDPRLAKPDLDKLICKSGQKGGCLSRGQIEAAGRIYAGPHDEAGRPLYPGGGFQPGSERNWTSFIAPPEGRARAARSGVDTTRYIMSDWGPSWDYSDFDFDRDAPRLAEMDVIYSASNPDIRAFKARGGKLLIYHGWNDPAVAPLNSVDYYETLERTMGGRDETRAFARLFMVPGMNHCFGGDGAFAIDYISAMEAWVERGSPPDRLTGYHLSGKHDGPFMVRRFPPGPSSILYSRPIYPYPIRAIFNEGSPSNDSSFKPH